jgi:acyl dehydratase
VVLDVECVDEAGECGGAQPISLFFRGLGGFGGERGPSSKVNLPPERPPDVIFRQQTRPNQALLYRLSSGDRNPLHADPQMAAFGGFERPILHGLCTLGFGARAVMREFAGNDVSRFRSIKTRFTKHVFPGETLITEMWRSRRTNYFRCKAAERDEVVLSMR